MDIVKATVRHDQDHVPCLRVAAEMVHNLFSSRVKPGVNPVFRSASTNVLGEKRASGGNCSL